MVSKLRREKVSSIALVMALVVSLTFISGCADRGTDLNGNSEVSQINETMNSSINGSGSDVIGSVSRDELDSLKEDLEEMEFDSPAGLAED
ncbi:MAG: hypothetical protein SVJ22_06870 [Halobacteriota archaeon]|nr:hypothetical protein [Halobacteriota archaeon]